MPTSGAEKPNGSWGFEYSYPLYFNDGTSAGTEMGYFSRRVVGTRKINCFLSGLRGQEALNDLVKACNSIAAAPPRVSAK